MKLKSLLKANMGIFSFLIVVLAAALGADSSFAMSEVTVVTNPGEKVPDSLGQETQMPGEGAAETTAREDDFTEAEIDKAIAEFQAYQTPVNASISALAESTDVESYEVTHYRTATPIFSIKLTNDTAIQATGTGSEREIELTVGPHISKQLSRLLYECKTVFVKEGVGYDEDGHRDGMLALYVLHNDRTNGKVVFKVINPNADNTKTLIPAGATILLGAVAAAESQREVAPDNFEPVPHTIYLQKRIFNIVMTFEWLQGKKKVNFAEEDLRKGALYNYKVNNEITDLLGVQSKFKVESGRQMAPEYVYTSRGLLRQVNMYYSYDAEKGITPVDLTAIAKMQFTKFSANNEAMVFCGQDFIEMLLNMDLTAHKEIKFEDVSFGGMSLKGWKNNFGTLNFVYTPVFDLTGYDACAFAVDLKNARKYNKRAGKMETVDMTEGAAETREAKREIYSQIYAVALRGYNAMFIGPDTQVASIGLNLTNLTTEVVPITAIPDAPNAGTIYYIAGPIAGYKTSGFYEYKNNAWIDYKPAYNRV